MQSLKEQENLCFSIIKNNTFILIEGNDILFKNNITQSLACKKYN